MDVNPSWGTDERLRRWRKRLKPLLLPVGLPLAIIVVTGIGLNIARPQLDEPHEVVAVRFKMCPAMNCVENGDTLHLNGERIRIADIESPQINPSRCAYEAQVGQRAKRRLQALLNKGPFHMEQVGRRDRDQYGRKLRILVRDGRSLGEELVEEGVARHLNSWTGSWC